MNFFKNKLTFISPIVVIAVLFIFSLTLIPSISPSPKDMPVAIVNEDTGITLPNNTELKMGSTISENIRSQAIAKQDTPIKWIEVNNLKEVQKGLDEKKYYAALVIPKDFSKNQASLQTLAPISPEIKILVNQGLNPTAANLASQMLNGIVDGVNTNIRTQILEGFKMQGNTITTEQAALLVSPIIKKVINVNEIGTKSANGNAPISMFQPLWMGSIAGAVIIFFSFNKSKFSSRKNKLTGISIQVLMGMILALIAGFGLTFLANSMLGLDIPKLGDTGLFLSLTYFTFFLMISAVLMWLGIKGLPIFILMLFFGAPLLAMPPEFLSPFYRNWIYSWLPMRQMIEGLRELFFFGKGFGWSHSAQMLTWIALGSLIVLLCSSLKKGKHEGADEFHSEA
ncbi:YhgE/Pip domain-containing protein [Bacillus sp. FJAT-22090]|uniref:YhgE/Pip domain-containing protein n=1 Tax=Bacillus sp. FJAT-22090 TaxID=1581038 RepID=UPI0011A9E7AA|nr:ABC transporter permease [Bacillus sp. FJAT-22090]